MTIHVSLASKKIVNLFVGKAEDAQKDGAEVLEPTTDTVTYSDGMSEEVYGFDIPVPAIDEEFDVALIGTKGKWYDHKVSVKNPVKSDDTDAKKDDKENKDADSKADDTDKDAKDSKTSEGKTLADLNLEDGDYTMDVTLTGGSGRATIDSPAAINVEGDKATATIVWSSPNYDYMLVDGEKYEPVNKDGNSTFEIPVSVFDAEMEVTADTVAMSEPHVQGHEGGPGLQEVGFPQLHPLGVRWEDAVGLLRMVDDLSGQLRGRLGEEPGVPGR